MDLKKSYIYMWGIDAAYTYNYFQMLVVSMQYKYNHVSSGSLLSLIML